MMLILMKKDIPDKHTHHLSAGISTLLPDVWLESSFQCPTYNIESDCHNKLKLWEHGYTQSTYWLPGDNEADRLSGQHFKLSLYERKSVL